MVALGKCESRFCAHDGVGFTDDGNLLCEECLADWVEEMEAALASAGDADDDKWELGTMRPDICIYHGNCADGFGAAWAVWRKFGDAVEYVPGIYGKFPPDVAGKHVVMVDFSYKQPVLGEMAQTAASIVILDHHKTAESELRDFMQAKDVNLRWDPECGSVMVGDFEIGEHGVAVLFDMDRSGAQIAWDFFHGYWDEPLNKQRRPELINYIADRDLWKFELPKSREIAAWLFSFEYDFGTWNKLAVAITHDFDAIAREGAAIERKHHKDIAELLAVTRREMTIGGHRVPVANLPYTMSSDAAGKLAEGQPFGACYFDRADGKRSFSLRSRDGGIDVSEVAKRYGGGGHRNAAGFEVPVGWDGDDGSFMPALGTVAP